MACLLIEYNVKCVLIKPVCTETDLLSVKAHKLSHTTQDVTVFTTQKQQIKGEADLLK